MAFIDEIDTPRDLSHWAEKMGNFFLSPYHVFFGKRYELAVLPNKEYLLKAPETFTSFTRIMKKVAVLALLPLALISSLFGYGIKTAAIKMNPSLAAKYSAPVLVNARTPKNFAGKLPPNPLSPNCVNSQEKSCWGELYNVDPIPVPEGIDNPVQALKELLAAQAVPNFDPLKMTLVEEQENYLHYTYTVVIPTGFLKGTYIDDVDIFFDRAHHCFQIRSASRTGFRDAVNLDMKKPGANKKRVEAIRAIWLDAVNPRIRS